MRIDEGYYAEADAGVYLRLYKMPNDPYQAHRGESVQMFKRQKQCKAMFSQDTKDKSYHYSTEQKISGIDAISLVETILRSYWAHTQMVSSHWDVLEMEILATPTQRKVIGAANLA